MLFLGSCSPLNDHAGNRVVNYKSHKAIHKQGNEIECRGELRQKIIIIFFYLKERKTKPFWTWIACHLDCNTSFCIISIVILKILHFGKLFWWTLLIPLETWNSGNLLTDSAVSRYLLCCGKDKHNPAILVNQHRWKGAEENYT